MFAGDDMNALATKDKPERIRPVARAAAAANATMPEAGASLTFCSSRTNGGTTTARRRPTSSELRGPSARHCVVGRTLVRDGSMSVRC